MRLLKG